MVNLERGRECCVGLSILLVYASTHWWIAFSFVELVSVGCGVPVSEASLPLHHVVDEVRGCGLQPLRELFQLARDLPTCSSCSVKADEHTNEEEPATSWKLYIKHFELVKLGVNDRGRNTSPNFSSKICGLAYCLEELVVQIFRHLGQKPAIQQ